jgi:hypothetical protein
MTESNIYRYRPALTILRSMAQDVEKQAQELTKSNTIEEVQKQFPIDIPEEFNGKEIWKEYLLPVKDQGETCGSCWAFATSGTLADRLSLQTRGQLKIDLSPAKMILCDFGDKKQRAFATVTGKLKDYIKDKVSTFVGCNGNTIQQSLIYLYKFGTSDTKCIPYDLGPFPDLYNNSGGDPLPLCQTIVGEKSDKCLNGQPMRTYRSAHSYTLHIDPLTNFQRIKYDIYKWGPVVSGFILYPDFYEYNPTKDGVYIPKKDQQYISGHAIEIVGWGIKNGINFWWVKNSWGEEWGEDGYFKCQMGNKLLDIEKNIISTVPDIPGVQYNANLSSSILESTEDKYDRQEFRIHESGYPYTIVHEVQNGRLFGIDLSPILNMKKIPDLNTFIVGKLKSIDFVPNTMNYQDPPSVFRKPLPSDIIVSKGGDGGDDGDGGDGGDDGDGGDGGDDSDSKDGDDGDGGDDSDSKDGDDGDDGDGGDDGDCYGDGELSSIVPQSCDGENIIHYRTRDSRWLFMALTIFLLILLVWFLKTYYKYNFKK